MKVQLDFDEKGKRQLDELANQTDSNTYKDLFNNALTLLQWAIRQRASGRHIASIDSANETFRELLMPAIETAAERQLEMAVVATEEQQVASVG